MRISNLLPLATSCVLLSGVVGFILGPIPATIRVDKPLINRFNGSQRQATANSNTKPSDRKPWEFFRFVQQWSKFVNLPIIGGGGSNAGIVTRIKPGDIIWEPTVTARSSSSSSNKESVLNFSPLDDVVMGGASASSFDRSTGTWSGSVTDANNGGFVGIRSIPPALKLDLSKCQGLEWKVRFTNNGNQRTSKTMKTNLFDNKKKLRFKVILRDSIDFNGICWATSVDLDPNPAVVNNVRIPLRKQIPTLFARTVPNQTFRPDNVMAVQLTFSKFEYDGGFNPNFELGDISLQILEIRAF